MRSSAFVAILFLVGMAQLGGETRGFASGPSPPGPLSPGERGRVSPSPPNPLSPGERGSTPCGPCTATLLFEASLPSPSGRGAGGEGRRDGVSSFRYRPVQLHLHGSLSEGDGTMRGHNTVAHELGTVDGLWWTDHDFRISGHSMAAGFSFDAKREFFPVPERHKPWREHWNERIGIDFEEEEDVGIERLRVALVHPAGFREGEVRSGRHALEIAASSQPLAKDWNWAGIVLRATGGRLRVPLAADVELEILAHVPAPPADERRAVIKLELSRQLEGLAELHYVLGAWGEPHVEKRGQRLVGVVPMPVELGVWNRLVLSPTHDAIHLGLGGRDNALRGIHLGLELRRGESGRLSVDELRLRRARSGQDVLAWARAEAAALGQEYGLFNHVGLEVSYGVHMNAYLPRIELPDPERFPGGVPPAELVAWARERGGIVSYNHVFGTVDSHRPEYEIRRRYLIENRAFGADLLEVGYPHRVFPLARHLEVWDELSRRGVRITGVGTSDSHSQSWGWEDGNNYVTWVWSRGTAPEDLIAGLRSGRAFFGDPMLFDGTIEVRTADGAPMGSVIESEGRRHKVELEIRDLPAGAEVRWIEDGEVHRIFEPAAGDFRRTFRVSTRDLERADDAPRTRFVRAEVWLGERGIGFSNCLYFVTSSNATASATRIPSMAAERMPPA